MGDIGSDCWNIVQEFAKPYTVYVVHSKHRTIAIFAKLDDAETFLRVFKQHKVCYYVTLSSQVVYNHIDPELFAGCPYRNNALPGENSYDYFKRILQQ